MSDDVQANVEGAAGVMVAYNRLTELGLVSDDPAARGINDDGMRTLADLLSVVVFQTGSGSSHAEQVASATSRAMLSALGDLYAEISGQPTNDVQTLQLLTAAVRTARS